MKKVRLPGHPYPEDVSDEFAASLEARRQAYGENAIASDLDSIGGVVARASLRDGNNNEVLSCDVSALVAVARLSFPTLQLRRVRKCDATA
jgi:hypothetical protein